MFSFKACSWSFYITITKSTNSKNIIFFPPWILEWSHNVLPFQLRPAGFPYIRKCAFAARNEMKHFYKNLPPGLLQSNRLPEQWIYNSGPVEIMFIIKFCPADLLLLNHEAYINWPHPCCVWGCLNQPKMVTNFLDLKLSCWSRQPVIHRLADARRSARLC